MKIMNKIINVCLIVVITFTTLFHPLNINANKSASTNNANFHIFLAQYVDNNYMLDKIDQGMPHQYLYEAMKQEFGETNIALTLTNLAKDWNIIFRGKTDYYEQVLKEILVNHINSDLFYQKSKENQLVIENQILKTIREVFEFDDLIDENIELYTHLSKLEFKSFKDVLEIPNEYFFGKINNLLTKFELPLSDSYFFKLGNDIQDFLLEVLLYKQIVQEIDEIRYAYEIMYRQTSNVEMQKAIRSILNKIDAAKKYDLIYIVDECLRTYSFKMAETTAKDMVMTVLNVVGLATETTGFITNTLAGHEDIAQIQLLLEVELEIEETIKNAIRYTQNGYKNNEEKSKQLNYCLMLLYDAYEYGIKITKDYNDTIFNKTKNAIIALPNAGFRFLGELLVGHKAKYTHDEFERLVKTYEGIIATQRSIFNSGWLEYNETYLYYQDRLSDYQDQSYVKEFYFEEITCTYDLSQKKVIIQEPIFNPSDTKQLVTYSSSDNSILKFTSENIPEIELLKTGTVTITAKTKDSKYQAIQQITIVDSSVQEENKTQISTIKDFTDYYINNHDGITITGLIVDFINYNETTNEAVYNIPERINDKEVTEIDFSNVNTLVFKKEDKKVYEITKIVTPSTTKRISNKCFNLLFQEGNTENCEIVLNEGLETIGNNAFESWNGNKNGLIIPSTVKAIGEECFIYSKVSSIFLKTPNLKTIPSRAFYKSGVVRVELPKDSSTKTIEESAFEETKNLKEINLPDTIQIIEKNAFKYSKYQFNELPSSLIEIHEEAFAYTDCYFKDFPSSIKEIGTRAFYWAHIDEVVLPNSIEMIGEEAFHCIDDHNPNYNRGDQLLLSCTGESNNVSLTIEKNALDDFVDELELPSSTRIIKKQFNGIRFDNLTWTNGIDEIIYNEKKCTQINDHDNHVNLYLKEVEYQGLYSLENHIFVNDLYFDYIEIPSNYLDNTQSILDGKWIKDAVIIGKANNPNINKYVTILKEAIDIEGKISYKDENGELTLLYENPSTSYIKKSLALDENQNDYIIKEPLSLYENHYNNQMMDKNNRNVGVIVSSNHSIDNITVNYWKEDNESEIERREQLGYYTLFEDLYLKQNYYHYFTITNDSKLDGKIRISIDLGINMNTNNFSKDNLGLYFISKTGRITRIPIYVNKTSKEFEIVFETNTLGNFALVHLGQMQETINSNHLEEIHNLYHKKPQNINENKSVTHENKDGTQSFISDSKDTIIYQPEIDEKIIEEIIEKFELELPNKNTIITEKNLVDKENLETVLESLTILEISNNKELIQIALNELIDQYHDIHIFRINEDESFDFDTDYKNNIKEVKEKKVNPLIHGMNQDYYEVKLNKGKYLFMYTKTNEKPRELSLINILFYIFIAMIIIGLIYVMFVIHTTNKKRKRRRK